MGFEGKVVIITGADGNLGQAVAAAFANVGAKRVLVGLHKARLTDVFGLDSSEQILVETDLTQASGADTVAAQALSTFGRIDVLCNLAGGFRMGKPVHLTPPSDWDFLLNLNLRTVLNMAQAVVPMLVMQGKGKIINVGAHAALQGAALMGAYAASKSALARVTEAMSTELREAGVNVNCVLPSIIDTPENRKDMPKVNPARWVAPHELAAAIVFLASDEAKAIHGVSLPVTGLS